MAPPDAPRLDAPDSVTLAPCLGPVKLPAGSMTQRNIERFWGQDRKHLRDCAQRQSILAGFITERDTALTTVPQ